MIVCFLILLVLLAVGYWLRQAHLQALRDRKVFEPYPPAPSAHDAWFIEQQRRDIELEQQWRAAVAANVARRKHATPLPALLRQQAE